MNEYEAMVQVQKYLEARIDMLGRVKGGTCRDSLKRIQECNMALEIVKKYIPKSDGYMDAKARHDVEIAMMKKAEEHHKKQLANEKAEKEGD